jgi:hypothetical protein
MIKSFRGEDVVVEGPVPLAVFLYMIRYAKSVKVIDNV